MSVRDVNFFFFTDLGNKDKNYIIIVYIYRFYIYLN